MPAYEITDDLTGMTIEVDGVQDLTEDSVRQYLAAAKKQAALEISDGSYRLDQDTQKPLEKKESLERLRKLSGYAMGINPDEVDVDSGMSMWERTKLDLLKDDQSRMEYLEKKFGSENVNALDVKGKTKLFYRDPESNKMTMVDEMRASLADFTADIAGEAVTTAGAVGGAVAGTMAGGPLGTIGGATAGAAAGHFLTGTALDVGSELASGQDVDLGEIATQRGIESAIGVPIDLVTLGAGRLFSRSLAGRSATKLIDEFDQAAKRVDSILAKEGSKLSTPPSLRTGLGSKQASEIAAARPNSKLAKELQAVRDSVTEVRESLRGRGRFGVSRDEFKVIADKVAQNYSTIISEVEQVDKALAKELKSQVSNRMKQFVAPTVTEDQVGKNIRKLMAPSLDLIKRRNTQFFANLDEVAKNVSVPIKSIRNAIQNAKKQFARFKEPESIAIYDDLGKRLKEGTDNVSFKEFREIMDEINGVISRNKEAGFTTNERVAARVWDNLKEVRDNILENNQNLKTAFDDAFSYYKNTYLDARRSAVGRSFREQLGNPAMTDSQVARLAIQDPEHIRQVTRVAEEMGGQREFNLLFELRKLYLNRIGLKEGQKTLNGSFDFNDDIVRELWGERQLRELKNLKNRILQAKEVKFNEIDPVDVEKYLSAFSGEERSAIYRLMRQRQLRGDQADSLKNSVIIKKLLPTRSKVTGKFLDPEFSGMDLVDFTSSFVSANNSKVRQAMKVLKTHDHPIGLQAFRQSYIGNLLKRFSGGAQLDRFGNPLWNPVAFEKAMKHGTMRNNAIVILGKDGFKDIMAANKVLLEAAETRGSQVAQVFQPRYSLSKGGMQLYGVGNLIGGLRGRALAMAYTTRLGSAIMRFLANPATDAETEAFLKKILIPFLTSAEGIRAIAIQRLIDPEFSEQIAPLFNAQPEE